MTTSQVPNTSEQVRPSAIEMLEEHWSCVHWARVARCMYRAVPDHAPQRKARIARLMGSDAEIYAAALACVEGNGHH